MINKNRKKSYAMDVRIDVRTMATLALFLEQSGDKPSSNNYIGRACLECFKDIIIKNHPNLEISDPEQALAILDTFKVKTAERGNPGLMRHLQDQSLEDFGACQIANDFTKLDNSQVEAIRKRMLENQKKDTAETREAFLNQMNKEEGA